MSFKIFLLHLEDLESLNYPIKVSLLINYDVDFVNVTVLKICPHFYSMLLPYFNKAPHALCLIFSMQWLKYN